MYEIQKIPKTRRDKLYVYLKKKLQEFSCPDSYLLSTSDKMVKDILRILKLCVDDKEKLGEACVAGDNKP